MEFFHFFLLAVENTLFTRFFYRLPIGIHVLPYTYLYKYEKEWEQREKERESACLFFSVSFLVHKISLGMHDSLLSFRFLFSLFSSGYRYLRYPPQKFSKRSVFFFFLYYVFGRIASI